MRIVCPQTILMKYHTFFVIFENSSKISNCRPLQIICGALWVKWLLLQEQDEIQYESYARIEHVLTGCWLHALKGKRYQEDILLKCKLIQSLWKKYFSILHQIFSLTVHLYLQMSF